jgi:hypothetical protein
LPAGVIVAGIVFFERRTLNCDSLAQRVGLGD